MTQPPSEDDAGRGQATPAAERSASIARGAEPKPGPAPDPALQLTHAVEVCNARGVIIRRWLCRLTPEEAASVSLHLRPVKP